MAHRYKYKLLAAILSIILTAAGANSAMASNACSQFIVSAKSNIVETSIYLLGNSFGHRSPYEINDSEIAEIAQVTTAIKKLSLVNQSIYVGVGRSPTPFLAHLQASEVDEVYNLPLSAFRNHPQNKIVSLVHKYEGFDRRLTQREKQKLFKHFDNFLPPPEYVEDKTLVLIDLVLSGASLVAANEHIIEYYKEKGATLDIILAPIAIKRTIPAQVPQLDEFQRIYIDEESSLFAHLRLEKYDRFSEFGTYVKGNTPLTYSDRNPLYDQLVYEFRSRINN